MAGKVLRFEAVAAVAQRHSGEGCEHVRSSPEAGGVEHDAGGCGNVRRKPGGGSHIARREPSNSLGVLQQAFKLVADRLIRLGHECVAGSQHAVCSHQYA